MGRVHFIRQLCHWSGAATGDDGIVGGSLYRSTSSDKYEYPELQQLLVLSLASLITAIVLLPRTPHSFLDPSPEALASARSLWPRVIRVILRIDSLGKIPLPPRLGLGNIALLSSSNFLCVVWSSIELSRSGRKSNLVP